MVLSARGSGQRIVFITGMHRSGTSFLSRALNLCGLYLPEPDKKGNQANEKGRWENTRLSKSSRRLFGPFDRWDYPVVIHNTDEVLNGMRDALNPYLSSRRKRWGWKDPRILITFEYWKQFLPDDCAFDLVISIRHPMEVAGSLERRNQFSIGKSLRIYDYYNSFALWYIHRGYPVHLFNFNDPDRKSEIERLCRRLDLKPNSKVWTDWFESKLVHHQADSSHSNPVYQKLLTHWNDQRQLNNEPQKRSSLFSFFNRLNEIPSQSNKPLKDKKGKTGKPSENFKPDLRMAVLLVNGTQNYKDKLWLRICLTNIIRNTSPYTDFKIFIWNHDRDKPSVQKCLDDFFPFVEVLDEDSYDMSRYSGPTYDNPSYLHFHGYHVHRTPLQILYDHAISRYNVDTVFTFDTDSWPIRQNWDYPLLKHLDGSIRLLGVWRDELMPTVPPFTHASCLGIKSETVKSLQLRFDYKPQLPEEDTLFNFTTHIRKTFGNSAILPLKRSNKVQYHPVFGGIYGGLIYHHHLGSRYQEGRNPKPRTKGWEERGEKIEYNKLVMDSLTERIFSNPEDATLEFNLGEQSHRIKLYHYYLKHAYSIDAFNRLYEQLKTVESKDPSESHALMGLIARYFAFNDSALNQFAAICEELGRTHESKCYRDLAQNIHAFNPQKTNP